MCEKPMLVYFFNMKVKFIEYLIHFILFYFMILTHPGSKWGGSKKIDPAQEKVTEA